MAELYHKAFFFSSVFGRFASSSRWRDTVFCGASGWRADAASGGGRACFQGRPERAAPDRALYGARRMKGGTRKQARRAASRGVPLFSDALPFCENSRQFNSGRTCRGLPNRPTAHRSALFSIVTPGTPAPRPPCRQRTDTRLRPPRRPDRTYLWQPPSDAEPVGDRQ